MPHAPLSRYATSVWKPDTFVLPRVCSCLQVVTPATAHPGVGGTLFTAAVTLAIGSFTRLLKNVPRTVMFDVAATLTPNSWPSSRSGPSASLESVSTAPTRKGLYNSLSVGARNPLLILPHTDTRSVAR